MPDTYYPKTNTCMDNIVQTVLKTDCKTIIHTGKWKVFNEWLITWLTIAVLTFKKKISAFEEGTLFANQVYQYVQCLHPI